MTNYSVYTEDKHLFVQLTSDERAEVKKEGLLTLHKFSEEDGEYVEEYYQASRIMSWHRDDCHIQKDEKYCGQIYGIDMYMFIGDSTIHDGYRYIGRSKPLYLIEVTTDSWGAESKVTESFGEAIDFYNKVKNFFTENLYFYKDKK